MIICDEASQLQEASVGIVLSRPLQTLVLAGDNKQLPATVISKLGTKTRYGRSLFDRLLGQNFPSLLLNVQYACTRKYACGRITGFTREGC